MKRLAATLIAATAMAGCANAPMATAQTPPPGNWQMPPQSTIQPETTITLNGRGSVEHAPDIAMITLGVSVEAETASTAMSQQTTKMNGVFAAVKAAGVADRDMQTSNLSLNPVYEYPNNQRPRLTGYNASNQITIKVRDLKNLGKTLDAVVKGGGNTINGVSFSMDKPESYQDEARVEAIKDAAKKAELYANAVGYKVKRIVTVSENEYYPQPVPMMARMQVQDAAESTPVAAGEVSLTQTVSVTFELTK
ncbi:MAG: SIMPL domain-containing protein [Hyphomonadaceae bacterium]|nr:SIMPL domain-containing protein [Hyphomonadaceae bacterium]